MLCCCGGGGCLPHTRARGFAATDSGDFPILVTTASSGGVEGTSPGVLFKYLPSALPRAHASTQPLSDERCTAGNTVGRTAPRREPTDLSSLVRTTLFFAFYFLILFCAVS